jgi:hypothetical protein
VDLGFYRKGTRQPVSKTGSNHGGRPVFFAANKNKNKKTMLAIFICILLVLYYD